MALTQERFNDIMRRLRSVLINRHPNWENHIRAVERFAAKNVVNDAPPPVPRDLDLDDLTAPQRAAFKARVNNALGASDQALLNELMP